MPDPVAELAAKIDAVAVPWGLERMARMGELASGAQNFYAVRLKRGTVFSSYDLALARSLIAWKTAPRVAHEVGGGLGGLSILLAGLGFTTTCLELDVLRFDAAVSLLASLRAAYPDQFRRCVMMKAQFPVAPDELPPKGAMALITNLVCTTTAEAKANILTALSQYRFSIIDVDRFLTRCTTEPERLQRLTEFAGVGLMGAPFLDLGQNGCFYRFTESRRLRSHLKAFRSRLLDTLARFAARDSK